MENDATEDPIVPEEGEKKTLLLLDDEKDILKALTRILRFEYDVVSFNDGHEALKYLEDHDINIMISDMRMPTMDGAEFLKRAKEFCPNSIRFLLTGYSDMESTIRAVNEGGIHTYLAKPWDNEGIKLTLSKASELFDLRKQKQALTDELQKKNDELGELNNALEQKVKDRTASLLESNKKMEMLLSSRARTFKDILAALSAIIQYATGKPSTDNERISEYAKMVAIKMGLPESEVTHCYLSALLHEIGLLGTVDPNAVDEEQTPSTQGSHVSLAPSANAEIGATIIGQIKRFAPLVAVIRHQDENFDGTGKPDHLAGDAIPVGSRILRVVKNYDFFVSGSQNPSRLKPSSARTFIKQQAGELYDPMIVDTFLEILKTEVAGSDVDLCVGLDEVKVGAILKQDVYHPNGQMMLSAGQEINAALLQRLQKIENSLEVPIAIYI
ncbi:HD domain-containing phosphohydrolase [Vibrio caribbeanicus]|uniref:Response regulator n=1 Tax=Vibrio caribbeanicus ATCC BAA-2122 TaxID=796620 RepID=E3BI34_9VIBR|nr:HD domain-containing phosphohydrolase [Vibrio caribbeanicus]EFP97473.1 response regulator [Vibrio caribbeanicus ATCC BAA-2122]